MVNRGDYLLALGARFSPVTVQPVHAHSHLHTHTWADLAPHTLNLTPRPDHSPRLLVRPRRTNCDSVRRTLGGCGCYPSWEPSRATCVDLHSTRPLFLHSANPAPLTVHNRHARSFSSKRAVPSVLGQPRPCAPGCTFVGGHSYSTWFLTSRNLCVVTCGFFSFHYSLPHHS